MKSKVKTRIDLTEMDDLNAMVALGNFLLDLGINQSEHFLSETVEIQENDFCGECESHKDCCGCHRDRDYDYDSDYEYDSWKDDQLLEEKG